MEAKANSRIVHPLTGPMNTVDFSLVNSLGNSFTANFSIKNTSGTRINGWTLEFDAPFTITSIRNAEIVSRQGSRYVVRHTSQTSRIPANGSISFEVTATNSGSVPTPPSGYVLNGAAATAAIPLPNISIDDVSITEGNAGTKLATFTVQLSQASSSPVTVRYATANDTATAGSDYTAIANALTFAPGETRKTVSVTVRGDTLVEGNETFRVNLSRATNARIVDAQGIGTIVNDDAAPVLPRLSINDITVTEGNSGTGNAVFTVQLSAASTQAIAVNFATVNGTATAGADYTAQSGTLNFAPGQTSLTLSVPVIGDTSNEPTETFQVNLSGATNATIADGTGVATIQDNDAPLQQGKFNYGEALQKSILFYEAQRSGKLPATNRVPWRGDSALRDGADVGRDLTGGYYDAGDHVKFGLPMAASMTMLGWGAIQYRTAYENSGQLPYILDAIKWGTDYILKAHTAPNEFWGQVGLGDVDHAFWGPPEKMTMARPAFKIDAQRPGSDLAGEAAAALAAASIAFRSTNAAYSDQLLQHATQLFTFADTFRGKYSDSIPDADKYYRSFNGFNDELAWSAIWLHKANEAVGRADTFYLNKAESLYQGIGTGWTQSWDEKAYGTAILLAQETGNARYRTEVENWLNYWTDRSGAGVKYTAGGLAWLNDWGSLRYTANTAFLAGVYSDTVKDYNGRYSNFATQQIDYMLGSNPNNRSYMVGFGNNAPKNPHHRGSHGSLTNNINDPVTNRNVLYGALVGGPSAPNDNAYTDDRTNFFNNEVALDYNAGFTGALARLFQQFGGRPLDSFQTGLSGTLGTLPSLPQQPVMTGVL